MSVTMTPDSPLMNVVSGIEERQCDLIGRQRNLRDKIATMERSIPALMAYNMWMTERDCPDTPYSKVREIMKQFSPHPDPADRLVAELRNTVDDLRRETAQLHDKIVDADVKLEEADMELESLELANKEMEERLIKLRKDVQRHSTPSLRSIHSEDLICLKKIRQLAEEELKLNNCVKQLESKEIMYRRQMNKLLSCKEYQCTNGEMKYPQKMDRGGKKPFCPLNRKCDLFAEIREKYPDKDKGRVSRKNRCTVVVFAFLRFYAMFLVISKTRCLRATPTINYEETSKKLAACEELRPLHSCCVSLDSRTPCATTKKRYDCRLCCGACREIAAATSRPKSPCFTGAPCESLLSIASETGLTRSVKLTQPPVPCDFGKTCQECETPAACKQIDRCDCNKNCICACELSWQRDRNVPSLSPSKKTHLRKEAASKLQLAPEADDSNSDDEFCECCPCDYGDTANLS
ncbi:uncharacterized protein LOC105275735 isoform X1 [Ooceraea biroi]|uniref:uncharacterized protein LOC105275735 isoform X1 n=1 Tax=Ooceraea biroi TaxID=2015173 RepID=UPI0005BCBAB5|nr:uncharacterized protein LOC105275735 isoform X1 [Ooceraea biroi]